MTDKKGKVVEVDPASNRDCAYAKQIIADLEKWAKQGRIKSLAVGVIFTDNDSFTDWCSDYPTNLEQQIGNVDMLKHRMLSKCAEEATDEF